MKPHSLGLLALVSLAAFGAAEGDSEWDRSLEQGRLLASRGQYSEARQVLETAREEAERFGPGDTRLAITLNNLGAVSFHLNDLSQAERCYVRSAAIWKAARGAEDVNLIPPLTNLSEIYLARHQWARAEATAQQTLDLATSKLGAAHPAVGAILAVQAKLRLAQGDLAAAAERAEQCLAVIQKGKPTGPELAGALDNLGAIYLRQERVDDAERLFGEAIQVLERSKQLSHPAWVRALNEQSVIYCRRGEYERAGVVLSRAVTLAEEVLAPNDPSTAQLLRNYAQVLRRTHRKGEAKKLETRAAAIEAESGRANGTEYTVDLRSLSGFR